MSCIQVQSDGCLFDLQSETQPDGNALHFPIATVKHAGYIPPQRLTDEKHVSSPRSPFRSNGVKISKPEPSLDFSVVLRTLSAAVMDSF